MTNDDQNPFDAPPPPPPPDDPPYGPPRDAPEEDSPYAPPSAESGRRRAPQYGRESRSNTGTQNLGIGSLVSSAIGCSCCQIGSVVGVILGIMAWTRASRELREVDAGLRPPHERSTARAGLICGIIGTILDGLSLVFIVIYLVFIFLGAAMDEPFIWPDQD